jgi:BlaI family transcriptional regulator, penicillinase repressor
MDDLHRVTDAQLAVLEKLWSAGPQTVRQLTAALYPGQSVSDYATVQKLLDQLEERGCVKRSRLKIPHVFEAIVIRQDLLDARLHQLADKLCDGSLTPVLMHLAERTQLTPKEREELRALLDAAKKRQKS